MIRLRTWRPTIRWMALFSCTLCGINSNAFCVTPMQANQMLQKARDYIYSQQSNDLWETHPTEPTKDQVTANPTRASSGQWGGETALAVYALLAAGESPQNPRLVPALKFLEEAKIKGVYALGLRSQLYGLLPTSKETRALAAADVEQYKTALIKSGAAEGLFDYLIDSRRTTRVDHSVSQYAVLGAWACERAGAEVPADFWKSVESAWIRDQNSGDGSWSYAKLSETRYPVTASMVLAGTATLLITQDFLSQNNGLNCTGNVVNKPIDAGLKWIGENFERVFTDGGSSKATSPYYAIYGLERVGVASGRKYFNHIDWYQRGSEYLLKSQTANGSWGSVANTCFSILFLSRGKAPVVFNKLQYDVDSKEGNWDQRPRDIANLTQWIAQQTERNLNWQIVDLHGSANDLLDAPVLYISGNKALHFSADQEAKLKRYCEDGGLILGNADGATPEFSQSFRKLGTKLFPAYEFRQLPSNHPIFNNEQYPRSGWKPAPNILSLGNGVREMMILPSGADPARHWQLREHGKFHQDFEFADDVLLYAVDKQNLLEKGTTFAIEVDPSIITDRTLKLARIQYAGNWDPELGGCRRLAAMLHNSAKVKLQISNVRLGKGQLGSASGDIKLAWLTGTSAVKFDKVSREEIKSFVSGGGTLLIDAAGGSTEFATSIEAELSAIFGTKLTEQLKQPLPPTDPLFNLRGREIKQFLYRPFARSVIGTLHDPLLCCIKIDARPAIYYSRMDLSGALVGEPTDGIVGYDSSTATAIMTNIILSTGLGSNSAALPVESKP